MKHTAYELARTSALSVTSLYSTFNVTITGFSGVRKKSGKSTVWEKHSLGKAQSGKSTVREKHSQGKAQSGKSHGNLVSRSVS